MKTSFIWFLIGALIGFSWHHANTLLGLDAHINSFFMGLIPFGIAVGLSVIPRFQGEKKKSVQPLIFAVSGVLLGTVLALSINQYFVP